MAGLLVSPVDAGSGRHLLIAGWLERVTFVPGQIRLRAKLDTGAKTSSLHVEQIDYFRRRGEDWVRFKLPVEKQTKPGNRLIETPLVREALIKRHGLPSIKRPVVKLAFCLNDVFYREEFTLADRGNFNYPVLLGRRFLQNKFLVDASATFMQKKTIRCQAPDP